VIEDYIANPAIDRHTAVCASGSFVANDGENILDGPTIGGMRERRERKKRMRLRNDVPFSIPKKHNSNES
jgi:hypothetical protein